MDLKTLIKVELTTEETNVLQAALYRAKAEIAGDTKMNKVFALAWCAEIGAVQAKIQQAELAAVRVEEAARAVLAVMAEPAPRMTLLQRLGLAVAGRETARRKHILANTW